MNKQFLIGGAMFGLLAGFAGVACSSGGTGGSGVGASGATTGPGSTTSSPVTTTSSTTGPGPSSTTSGMGGNPVGPASSSVGVGGSNPATTTTSSSSTSTTGGCTHAIGTLHPPKAGETATIYCPFSGIDGGKDEYCTPNAMPTLAQHCCVTPQGSVAPSACVTDLSVSCDTLATGSVDWQCEDPVTDCLDSANPVCCGVGAYIGLGGVMAGAACENFAHHMTGATCVPAGQCPNLAPSAGANPPNILVCTSNGECPSGQQCLPISKAGNQIGACCVTAGNTCLSLNDCCSGTCTNGKCATAASGQQCIASGDCASGTCTNNVCM